MWIFVLSALLLTLGVDCSQGRAPCSRSGDFVDLSHWLTEDSPVWPGHKAFNMTILELRLADSIGQSEILVMSSHFGTHIDAPVHIVQKKWTLDQIPKKDLYGPGVVIDVKDKARQDPNYAVTKEDILSFEEKHGRIPVGGIVLFNSGWGRKWDSKVDFLGTDTTDLQKLANPGLSAEGAEFLVHERDIVGIGFDGISYDVGNTKDYPSHITMSKANKWGLENVANLDKLPPAGFQVYVFPLKLTGASGAPARVIAFL